MNGPEHYKEAERLLAGVGPREMPGGGTHESFGPETVSRIQRAQVHATLALAAATVDVGMKYDGEIRNDTAWRAVNGRDPL